MSKDFNIMVVAVLIALIAPAVAESPLDAVNLNRRPALQLPITYIIDSADHRYALGDQTTVDLSGISPAIFRNAAFVKDAGGLSSGTTYTPSINAFINADSDAGVSRVAKKPAKIGLVHWP